MRETDTGEKRMLSLLCLYNIRREIVVPNGKFAIGLSMAIHNLYTFYNLLDMWDYRIRLAVY